MSTKLVAQHPLVRLQSRRILTFAGVSGVLGLLAIPVAGSVVGASMVSGAGMLLWRAIQLRRRGQAVQLHNAALERVMRGQIDEAEELLGQISPRMNRWSHLARANGLLRAMIAFYRGDAELAASLATTGIAIPFSRLQRALRPLEEVHQARLLALRALAHASTGQAEQAERDAYAAETSPGASPDVVARAALARAVTSRAARGWSDSPRTSAGRDG